MRKKLNESLPPLIPEFPIEVGGHHLTLRYDVNVNKTKKGVKLQFVMKDVPEDPRQAQLMANEIGTSLQQKFGNSGLQIIYDVENPYKNVVGFLLPLPSLADYINKHILQEELGKQPAEKKSAEQLPPAEQPPTEEPVKEIFMRRAGLK